MDFGHQLHMGTWPPVVRTGASGVRISINFSLSAFCSEPCRFPNLSCGYFPSFRVYYWTGST